jgi:hypothetical protein
MNVASPQSLITLMPALLMLCFIACFVLFKIPTMTASLLSGHVGGACQWLSGLVTGLVARGAVTQMEITMRQLNLTRAAGKYFEQHGEPLVMNTYLKITVLVLCAICAALAALVYRSQNDAFASMDPMIVRFNDVGRAEAIDYRNFQYRPQEAENKYYLSRWAELYFSRNRFTIERDQPNALYFLNGDVQHAVIDQERKDDFIQTYVKDSGLPFVDVEVKNVILDDLRQSRIRRESSSKRCSPTQPTTAK